MAYTQFRSTYGIRRVKEPPIVPEPRIDELVTHRTNLPQSVFAPVIELQELFGGMVILNGAYGVFDEVYSRKITRVCCEYFSQFEGYVIAVGRDWLGNIFCVDFSRIVDRGPLILVFDINSGEVFNTKMEVEDFHEISCIEDASDVFNLEFYENWSLHHERLAEVSKCVGYIVPLALGGLDDISNMQTSDLEVYWSLTGQIGTP